MKRSSEKKKPEYVEYVEDGMITQLLNPSHFFIGRVFISYEKGKYRLLAIGNSCLYVDKNYNTPRGAKIAFSRIFSYKNWNYDTDEKKKIKQNWSPFYKPERKWLTQTIPQATKLPTYGIEENRW
jgi:hypothetical protein